MAKMTNHRKGRFAGWDLADVQSKAEKPLKPETNFKVESTRRVTRNVLTVVNSQPNCVAWRVNNVGVYDENLIVAVRDKDGRKIGEKKGGRRRGNTEKGLFDIWCCIRGFFFVVEVKAGKDTPSPEQMQKKFEVERAYGLHVFAYNTDQFTETFTEILNALPKWKNGKKVHALDFAFL